LRVFDVAVVGAGVVGCSIARELSRFRLDVVVLEKEWDVAEGASGANSGVVHSGFKESRLSLKALYCVEGNRRFEAIARELGVPYRVVGTYTVGEGESDLCRLERLKEAGEAAGARGLRIIDEDELRRREPHVNGKIALYAPEGGITDPHAYVIALAENAFLNGVKFRFNSEVAGIRKSGGFYLLETRRCTYKARFVVNCAGVHADRIASMVGYRKHKVSPCRGEYLVLDKKAGHLINGMIYPMPPERTGGIGVHLTPTIDGNIIIGPTAEYVDCGDDAGTTASKMNELLEEAAKLVPGIRMSDVIHEYSGLRAKIIKPNSPNEGDFVIDESPDGFVQLLGIESPGLTAAPVIAEKVREVIGKHRRLERNSDYNPIRQGRARFSRLSDREKSRLIKSNPDYGLIVCRCEEVTKKEVMDVLNNPLGVRTLKGVRVRTRAGMGRCQGSFCTPRIMEIALDMGLDLSEFTLKGVGSRICTSHVR
jgi:glycerol-3-phosphate dehydrogenase